MKIKILNEQQSSMAQNIFKSIEDIAPEKGIAGAGAETIGDINRMYDEFFGKDKEQMTDNDKESMAEKFGIEVEELDEFLAVIRATRKKAESVSDDKLAPIATAHNISTSQLRDIYTSKSADELKSKLDRARIDASEAKGIMSALNKINESTNDWRNKQLFEQLRKKWLS